MASVIPAAGTLPWRRREGRLEVALVHRPKYDDWSWAKGKLDPGEQPCVAAVRETVEETGLVVRLGRPLPSSEYPVLDSTGAPWTKQVHYWAAKVTGGSGILEHEIDEVAWVDVRTANDRLDYARDREQLLALVRADRAGELKTWPLVLVRHAKARPRGKWTGDDRQRPLDPVGRQQAATVATVLGAYGITRVVTSTSARCVETVEPYAVSRGLSLKRREGLSEEGFATGPEAAHAELEKLLRNAEPAALCSHGPVLPALLGLLAERLGLDPTPAPPTSAPLTLAGSVPVAGSESDHRVSALLVEAGESAMRKGEVLVCHVRGAGASARVVDVERIDS